MDVIENLANFIGNIRLVVWANAGFASLAGLILMKFIASIYEAKSLTREYLIQNERDRKRLDRDRDWKLFNKMTIQLCLFIAFASGFAATF